VLRGENTIPEGKYRYNHRFGSGYVGGLVPVETEKCRKKGPIRRGTQPAILAGAGVPGNVKKLAPCVSAQRGKKKKHCHLYAEGI